MHVTLFVTCVVDLFEPEVGVAAVRVLRAGGCEVSVPARPDVLRPAGVELRLRRRGRQGRPHHARRAREPTGATPWWCRPARAPRWSGCSGRSCSRWSATTTPPTGPARLGAAHEGAERAASPTPRPAELHLASPDRVALPPLVPHAPRAATRGARRWPCSSRSRAASRSPGRPTSAAAASAACSRSSCPRRRVAMADDKLASLAEAGADDVVGLRHVVPAAPARPRRARGTAAADPAPRRGAGRRAARCRPTGRVRCRRHGRGA